ncbi:hypothetical protein NQ318_019458 [Aromia moschata]|uniref:Uncharacterized protein n=1 Tax=Aromia moschata TaxID=1265417 RepID=A0AAV8YBE8_9CUCU|nr:hypothetical protein NQ318_019458 [Aromia moschata]
MDFSLAFVQYLTIMEALIFGLTTTTVAKDLISRLKWLEKFGWKSSRKETFGFRKKMVLITCIDIMFQTLQLHPIVSNRWGQMGVRGLSELKGIYYKILFSALIKLATDVDRRKNSILWTDKSRFHNNGTINRHNCHYWSDHNPHWMRETNFQRIWGINVWCGMIDGSMVGRIDGIIGPKFYRGTLTVCANYPTD